jgi:murein DD-endopeptidase MepM/ murein hydrolase activator NlpD
VANSVRTEPEVLTSGGSNRSTGNKSATSIRLKSGFLTLALTLLLALHSALPTRAQPQCGVVDGIGFPVDTNTFTLAQDYAAPSPRHQGRFHTGEDWYGGTGSSYGQFVSAIANGRVTFSSPNGWGGDGGVIIIEHTFPDDTIAYSMYGHVTDQTGVQFPAVYACVRQGDIIAAIGDVRPAPHLHLEIRVNNPDIPGAGYSWDYPTELGLRRPSKFILNWSAWLTDAFRWRLDLGNETGPAAPPVPLDDLSLVYLDGARVSRVSPDGRILWRVNLDKPAVGVLPNRDNAAIAYADGTIQPVARDGTVLTGELWSVGFPLGSAPMQMESLTLFHSAPDTLLAFDAEARSLIWRLDDVPEIARWHFTGELIGLMTSTHELLTLSPTGALIDRAWLRGLGALASVENGDLLAYTAGGLWRVDTAGVWSPALPLVPPGNASSAVIATDIGLVLFNGERLMHYNADGGGVWQITLPDVRGQVELFYDGAFIVLTSSGGDVAVVRASDAAVCNTAQIYGDHRSKLWRSLDDDGVLRMYVADQIIGLDWRDLLLACG